MINDWENISAYWEESEQSETLGDKYGLLQIQLGSMEGRNPKTFCGLYHRLSLKTLFPELKLTKNCYINMNISFS